MTRALPASPADWHHAPDHLVGLVAALAGPPPRTPTGEPTPQQWYAQLRRVVDQIWSTAWLAGATDTAARMPVRMEVTLDTPLPPVVAAAAGRAGNIGASLSASQVAHS